MSCRVSHSGDSLGMQYVQRSLQRSVIDTRKYEMRWPKRYSIVEATAGTFVNQDGAQLGARNRVES
jgi:hypothetical protein